jgi:hypothetical protein
VKVCGAEPLGGGRCELAEGHEGDHQRTSWPYGYGKPPMVFTWTDESQTRLADRQGSRFD